MARVIGKGRAGLQKKKKWKERWREGGKSGRKKK